MTTQLARVTLLSRIEDIDVQHASFDTDGELIDNFLIVDTLLTHIKKLETILNKMDCEGEWCGKSPTKNDNGLCAICKYRTQLWHFKTVEY